ncbi:PGN_0703 family putative restriction endonuclease [uncultured Clostridium sp.]|uniref:PGN_0703 family putative restriction endonuclease n=1 Tax=uncultured Clostridium sp. TaxID=59620 RepID=UPI0028EE1B2A|nr:hypothetical protein [uncultured Clostridium sp.]
MRNIKIGDQGADLHLPDELNMFLDDLFGKKPLIIIKVNGSKNKIIKELERYSKKRSLEVCKLDARTLNSNNIEEMPYSDRKNPYYISKNKQMIIVDNLDESTDLEVVRTFMYMADIDCCYDDIINLPKDKLPYGSAYVFIAEDSFPIERLASISSRWNDKAAILDLRDFQTRVKEHMGEYKINKLKTKEDGKFIYKGKELLYKHILPEDKKELNIIENYRDGFYKSEYSKIEFHKYFHHLNSSQAMCINFFYPLIKEKYIELILDIIGIKREGNYEIQDISFEKKSELEEGQGRKTNFDFYIKLKSGIKIYFEIKYTENEFGKAQNDEAHKDKFREVYKPLLYNNEAIKEIFKTEEYFLNNYQIMRNIVHISKDSYVVFLYPKENYGIRKQALKAGEYILEHKFTDHFILYTWEDIVDELTQRLPSGDLKDYYNKEFTYKYLIK